MRHRDLHNFPEAMHEVKGFPAMPLMGQTYKDVNGNSDNVYMGRLPDVLGSFNWLDSAPVSPSAGDSYLLAGIALTIDSITWQSGTTVRIDFTAGYDSADYSAATDRIIIQGEAAEHNGSFDITTVNAAYLEYTNPSITDGTLDVTGSGNTAFGVHEDWDTDDFGIAAVTGVTAFAQFNGTSWVSAFVPNGITAFNSATGNVLMITGGSVVIFGGPTSAKIKTGTYTGDGSLSLAITGTGFPVKYVKIARSIAADLTALNIVESWDTVNDDSPGGQSLVHSVVAGAEHLTAIDSVISLDSDGFTVGDRGANLDPNASGIVYNYIAFG